MKNTLLISSSFAVLLTAAPAMAEAPVVTQEGNMTVYTGGVLSGTVTKDGGSNSHIVLNPGDTGMTIENANISLPRVGPEETASRVAIGGLFTEVGTITFKGSNTINDQLTLEANNAPTIDAEEGASLRVNGYLTVSPDAQYDLSKLDLTISNKNNTANEGASDGALVLGNKPLTVGNLTFDDGRISIWNATSELQTSEDKTVTFNGTGRISGLEGSKLTISGDGDVVANGNLSIENETTFNNKAVANNGTLNVNANVDGSADLTNTGTVNIAKDITLGTTVINSGSLVNNGTITSLTHKGGSLDVMSGATIGSTTLAAGTSANVHVDKDFVSGNLGSVTVGSAEATGDATLKIVLSDDVVVGEDSKITAADSVTDTNGKLILADNLLYTYGGDAYDAETKAYSGGELEVVKKAADAVAADVAATGQATASQAGTLAAFTAGNLNNQAADNVATTMSGLLQTDNVKAAADIASAVAPEAAPMTQAQVTEHTNQIFNAVSTRLSGGAISGSAEGAASGDSMFERGAVWVQGLINKAKLDDTSKGAGFKSNSAGIALGGETYAADDVKVGAGYAYTSGDIKGLMRKTDVDTNTAFVYGEYKPSAWFVNGIASYSWGDYKENKYDGNHAKYNVDSFALQAMTGYDFNVNGYILTPEAGLRYIHAKQDGYTDSLGQTVSQNNADLLTGIIGAKATKDFALENGMNLRPEIRVAMTYDMKNDAGSSVVSLANGSVYNVEGRALKRLGFEAGAGITADVNDDVELSLGYEGKFREDYQDHTGLLNAKYKF